MIVIKIIGGLGNQMFQIAFARRLALELNDEIYLDISAYKKYKIRSFSLSNLYIHDLIKYSEDMKISKAKSFCLKSSQKVYHVYHKLARELTGLEKYGKFPYKFLSRKGLYFNFDRYYYDHTFSNAKLKSIYGYFQSEKYFEKYKEQICQELRVKTEPTREEKLLLDEIKSCNSVAVSMRLGDDYLRSPILNVCNKEFYYKGMEHIYKQNKEAVFYIFSDCIDRVKEEYSFKYPVRYVDGFKDYESLRLLYSCKHFVISNSSFSWWGAYLGSNPNKIIVAPNKWYSDARQKPDIFFENMTLIEV